MKKTILNVLILTTLLIGVSCSAKNTNDITKNVATNETKTSVASLANEKMKTTENTTNSISNASNTVNSELKDKKPIILDAIDVQTGKKVNSDILNKDTNVLVIWQTGCEPCIAELKALEKVYKDYPQMNIFLMGVDVDTNYVKDQLKQMNITIPAYILTQDFINTIRNKITATPAIWVLDKNKTEKFLEIGIPENAKTEQEIIANLKNTLDRFK